MAWKSRKVKPGKGSVTRRMAAEHLEGRRVLAADVMTWTEVAAEAPEAKLDAAWYCQEGDAGQVLSAITGGDLNNDGTINAADIDMLAGAMRDNSSDMNYDLDQDGSIGQSDMDMLVHTYLNTDYGDANLDGSIDEVDEAMWRINRFQMGTGWMTGDFNGDGMTDVSDYNVWNQHRSTTPAAALSGFDRVGEQPELSERADRVRAAVFAEGELK